MEEMSVRPTVREDVTGLSHDQREALERVEQALHWMVHFGDMQAEVELISHIRSVIRDVLNGDDPRYHLTLLMDEVWGGIV